MPDAKKAVRVESFSKTARLVQPMPSRSLVFETEKQRNTAFLQKGISKPGSISYTTLRRAAMSVHIARICINTLKEQVTKTKWIIKPIDAKVQVTPEVEKRIKQVTELFRHPNQNDETFRTMLDKMLEDLLVLDSVSLEKTRFPDGTLAELHFVDSATIRPVFDEFGDQDVEIPLDTQEKGRIDLPVSYVQVMNNSQYGGPESGSIVAAWPKKDFIYFHMHPQGSMEGIGYGLSPLEGVISVVSSILNADNYNGNYFEEGSFPPVILHIQGQVNQRDVEMYREYLYSELQGNFHKPAIMAGGQEMNVLNLKDLSNRDMEFMDYMKFMARLLAAAYGLSGQDIGLTEEVGSKNVSETMKDLSTRKGYGSILHLLKEVFNQEIIWKDFGFDDLEFDWVAEDMTDPKDSIDINKKSAESGFLTLNEVRRKMGETPFGAWADKPMVLTAEGYKPIVAESDGSDEESGTGDDKNEFDQKKEPEIKSEHKTEVGKERTYRDQNGKPDEKDKNETSTKKSVFSRVFGAFRKSGYVFTGDHVVSNVDDIFREAPAMFGELVDSDKKKRAVVALFKDQNVKKIEKAGYTLRSYTYHYNQAVEALFEFVNHNPHSYGGIIISQDERGLKYTLYVYKEAVDLKRTVDIK